ncbi:hypothetical protein, partial [Bartonella phoceensis]|uniref:hypothetical protein n=1 Tax=Bartonella phoceensis TaxID=270249 RepID=UPI001ABA9AA9
QSEDSSVVHYDRKDGKTDYTNVTLGGKEKSLVGLHNVGNGQINESSHDAVNGSQLYSMSNMLASYFGGGARYENGEWTGPTFKVPVVKED